MSEPRQASAPAVIFRWIVEVETTPTEFAVSRREGEDLLDWAGRELERLTMGSVLTDDAKIRSEVEIDADAEEF